MTTFRIVLALILSILIMPPQQAAGACIMSSGIDIPADLATAQAGPRCLDLPAGTFSIAPNHGDYLSLTADNVEIRGQGEGKTIIQTSGITLTNNLYIIASRAANSSVHDLTIQIGAGYSGNYEIGAILVGEGATRGRVERVEVSGGYSGTGGGGFGIGTYKSWNQVSGVQDSTIADCWIHDSSTTGIGISSIGNIVRHNRIERVGNSTIRHGIYGQGGNTLYEGNTIIGASGYSFHLYKQVPNLDASGDKLIGNTSIDPGAGHLVLNGLPNGANPAFPVGTALTRYAVISGNVFKNTLGHRSGGVWANGVPALIDGNTLEDIFVTSGAGWIEDSGGSVISNNLLTTSGVAPDGAVNFSMIRVTGSGSTVADNHLTMSVGCCVALNVQGYEQTIQGNTVRVPGTTSASFGNAMSVAGDNQIITGNRIVSTGVMGVMVFSGTPTGLTMTGNTFKRAPALGALWNITLTGVTGNISANVYDGALVWSGNSSGVLR